MELIQIVDLADESVDSQKIKDGAIQTVDLADESVDSKKIKNGSIQTVDLADESVDSQKIKGDSISNAQLKLKSAHARINMGGIIIYSSDSNISASKCGGSDCVNVNYVGSYNAGSMSLTGGSFYASVTPVSTSWSSKRYCQVEYSPLYTWSNVYEFMITCDSSYDGDVFVSIFYH
jgi:hypothetical protein